MLKMIPENNARILKMSFDKTAEGTVPTFCENIANNTVKFEILFIQTSFSFSKCSSEHAESTLNNPAKAFCKKLQKIAEKQKTVQNLSVLQTVTLDK